VGSHLCHEKECDRLQKTRQSAGASTVAVQGKGDEITCNWLVILVVLLIGAVVALGLLFGLDAKKASRTASPTQSPTLQSPTGAPLQSPTGAPLSVAANQFLSGLPAYSMELAKRDANSSQAKALAWIQKDQMFNEHELYRLNQRYALAVLYYSTQGDSWKIPSGWVSDDDECDWYTSWTGEDGFQVCDANRMTGLFLEDNGLRGTLPAELELMTDLRFIQLLEPGLSFAVHPE
jgi:hypothetical protein